MKLHWGGVQWRSWGTIDKRVDNWLLEGIDCGIRHFCLSNWNGQDLRSTRRGHWSRFQKNEKIISVLYKQV